MNDDELKNIFDYFNYSLTEKENLIKTDLFEEMFEMFLQNKYGITLVDFEEVLKQVIPEKMI